MSLNDSYAHHVVTAVIVAHDGARWLPEATQALLGQTRPVQRIVAVDTGSRDRSGTLLAETFGPAAVFGMDRTTGYGAAVARALAHRAANIPVTVESDVPPGDTEEWIWLLHDDCAPEPDALAHLLHAADDDRLAAVLGPKVRDWADRKVLIEVGVTIDGAGRRETGLEWREYDQGQHDGDRDVLAVGSAGMLVRRDVWDQLGGFDPGLPLFRDDVDFCWRVHAAGHRVRFVTHAVLYHAEASARRRRRISAVPDHPRRVDRRNALYVLFANLPAGALVAALVRNFFASLLRVLILLLAKQPATALDEVLAITSVYGRPGRLWRARRRRARGRRRTYAAIRPFMPRGHTSRRFAEMVDRAMSGAGPAESTGAHHASGDDQDEEDAALLTDSGLLQRLVTNPVLLLFVGLALVTLIAERSLIGTGRLGGGALVPVWGGASDLWREYFAGFHDVGIGSGASTPPWVAVLAALSTLMGGKPWLAVDVLLLGCVPLAGMAAYLAARRVVGYVPARLWAAVSYAFLPVATGAVAAGRIGTAITIAGLPIIGILAARMLTAPPRHARRAAWAIGLVLAVCTAFVPLTWVLVTIVGGLAALAFGHGRREIWIDFGVAVLAPPILLFPWTLDLLRHPSMFLLQAGLHRGDLVNPRLSGDALLMLNPGGPGMPPIWVTAGFLLTGLIALLMRRRRVPIVIGWALALFGLLVAILVSRIEITPPSGGTAAQAWPGVPLAFVSAGVLLAAVAAAESLPDLFRAGSLRRLGVIAVAAAACATPVLAAGHWIVTGVRGPLTRSDTDVVPAFVAASSNNALRLRTLVLRPGPSELTYAVLRGQDPMLGEAELPAPPAASRQLDGIVAGLASGSAGDQGGDGHALTRFAIGYVLLPAPIDQRLLHVLDGVPALRRVSLTPGFALWQLTDTAARVRVVEGNGLVVPVASGRVESVGAPAPSAGGTLVLAEPADGGWHASLHGQPLTPLATPVDGWAQGFQLPSGGGRLDITRDTIWRQLALVFECLVTLLVIGLGLPGTRAARLEPDHVEDSDDRPTRRDHRVPSRSRGHRVRRSRAAKPAPAPAAPGPQPPEPATPDGEPQPGTHTPSPRRAVTRGRRSRSGTRASGRDSNRRGAPRDGPSRNPDAYSDESAEDPRGVETRTGSSDGGQRRSGGRRRKTGRDPSGSGGRSPQAGEDQYGSGGGSPQAGEDRYGSGERSLRSGADPDGPHAPSDGAESQSPAGSDSHTYGAGFHPYGSDSHPDEAAPRQAESAPRPRRPAPRPHEPAPRSVDPGSYGPDPRELSH